MPIDPIGRARALKALSELQREFPQLRLMQIVGNATKLKDNYYVEDKALADALEKFSEWTKKQQEQYTETMRVKGGRAKAPESPSSTRVKSANSAVPKVRTISKK